MTATEVTLDPALRDRLAALVPTDGVPESSGGHCRQPGCACTHTAPCDYGWIELPVTERHGAPYAQVAPCPICRPSTTARINADRHRSQVGGR